MAMNRTIPAYINTLSGDNFEILEELFLHKYRKFMIIYHMIDKYSDSISTLKYKNRDKNILDIDMCLDEDNVSVIMDDILSASQKYDEEIYISTDENIIHIKIIKNESVPS